jgi:hypothetical protein
VRTPPSRSLRRLMFRSAAGVLVAASALPAQGYVKVVDSQGYPVPYAAVQIGGTAERATDTLGVVRQLKIDLKPQSLRVRRIGFAPFAGEVTPTSDGEFRVVLGPTVNGLDTVRTVAVAYTPLSRTGFYDRMDRVHNGAVVGEFIVPEELEARRPTLITQMFRGRRYVGITRGKNNKMMVTGRGGSCGMTILVDGVRVNNTMEEASTNLPTSIHGGRQPNPGSGEPMSLDETIGANEVMAVEVYPSTSNAPAELVPLTGSGSCGIVAIWTGPRR